MLPCWRLGVDIGGFAGGYEEGGNTSVAPPKQVLKSWNRSNRRTEMKHSLHITAMTVTKHIF